MLSRLPYRLQIPLGLSLAVLLTALLVIAVAARISAATARADVEAAIARASALLSAQARPYLLADDTWRAFVLLRDIAGLLPSATGGHVRALILDAQGRTLASSDPVSFPTHAPAAGIPLESVRGLNGPGRLELSEGGLALINPVLSEDGASLGYSVVTVGRQAFEPDWPVLSKPPVIGAALAVLLLVPLGWVAGRRMTRPVRSVASVIARIGRDPPEQLAVALSAPSDPELTRISAAVLRLIRELQQRQQAQQRALSSERLAAVGRMTAAVAHEINNPLGGLLNAVQTLRLHGGDDTTRHRALDLLSRGLHQIRATVSAIVPQARIEDRVFTSEDFDDVLTLTRTATTVRPVSIMSETVLNAPMQVEAVVLRQVLLNLLLNAVKAAEPQHGVQVRVVVDGSSVEIAVQHQGQRLTQDELAYIVGSAASDDPRGFGLWVCHQVAQQRGGEFGVDESRAPGTRLVFRIPNHPQDDVHSAH